MCITFNMGDDCRWTPTSDARELLSAGRVGTVSQGGRVPEGKAVGVWFPKRCSHTLKNTFTSYRKWLCSRSSHHQLFLSVLHSEKLGKMLMFIRGGILNHTAVQSECFRLLTGGLFVQIMTLNFKPIAVSMTNVFCSDIEESFNEFWLDALCCVMLNVAEVNCLPSACSLIHVSPVLTHLLSGQFFTAY